MSARRPPLPERLSSLMPKHRLESLSLNSRKVTCTASQKSVAITASESLERQISEITSEIEYLDTYKEGVMELRGKPESEHEKDFAQELEDVDKRKLPLEREFVVLKRQKKFIEEDLEDQLPHYETVQDAYASVLVDKTMSATGKQKKSRFNQSRFKKAVVNYYQASRTTEVGNEEVYCHLLQSWLPAKLVKCSHLVPKSLQSEELSYLFGVGEALLSDPRNGITLFLTLEKALDEGNIVIVPVSPAQSQSQKTTWKCVLVDDRMGDETVTAGLHLKDFDGKELEFLGDNRPARRFLYFRYLMTYLHQKKRGNMEWTTKVEARGKMWATAGRYLRHSMLPLLARKVSDHYLPEAFWEENTFADAEMGQPKPADEEEVLSTSLGIRMKEEMGGSRGDSDDDESDEDDNEDEANE